VKVVLKKKTYNTDTATKVGNVNIGIFGDPCGYEENLFQTLKGDFFIYGRGGESSRYPREHIIPITNAEAQSWIVDCNA